MRFIPASCSEPSITSYCGFCYLAVDPCHFRGNSIHRTSKSLQVNPSIPPSVSSSYVTSASSSIVVCPLRPKKGDSLSDPSSFGLQKFANLASSNQFPQVTLEVIYRSPLRSMHSPLIRQARPKHFARIVFRQPLFTSSTPKIFVLRIQLLYLKSSPTPFFFKPRLDLPHHATSIQIDVGATSLKRGIEGY